MQELIHGYLSDTLFAVIEEKNFNNVLLKMMRKSGEQNVKISTNNNVISYFLYQSPFLREKPIQNYL